MADPNADATGTEAETQPLKVLNVTDGEVKKNPRAKFAPEDKKRLGLYITGIMFYKFAFESINASISLYVLTRMNTAGTSNIIWANLVILYSVCQALGSSISGPLLNRYPPSRIMSAAIGMFGLLILIYNFIEAGTSGTRFAEGIWETWIMYPLYMLMGICIGISETGRRTIAPTLVGVDPEKLRSMDSLVHVFYEIAGTSGAFLSTITIKYFSYVYSTGVIAAGFFISSLFYFLVATDLFHRHEEKEQKTVRCHSLWDFMKDWWNSCRLGATIVFSSRRYIWLLPCYVLPLVIHRLFENTMFPFYAKYVLKDGSLTGFMTALSNLGELLGALLVFILVKRIRSPIPWLRLDAIMMFGIWSLAYIGSSKEPLESLGKLAPIIVVISLGWAAGDVSLLSMIQRQLSTESESQSHQVQAQRLNAVMSFLYSMYVFFMVFIANGVGSLFDLYKTTNPRQGLFWGCGVMMSCIAVVIFFATFIPPKKSPAEIEAIVSPTAKQVDTTNV